MKIVMFSMFVLSFMAAFAHADAGCDSRLRQLVLAQAEKDFPGRELTAVFQSPPDQMMTFVCIEVRDAYAGDVVGVYATDVDEVCELNNAISLQPSMKSCGG